VQIAPNGADPDRYQALPDSAALRQELGLPPGLLVAYTGHFYAGRGAELLFQLAQRFPQVHFLWVGGRPEELHIWQARLETAGVRNVLLTGFIENRRLPRYQAAADILLMPYERAIAGSSGGDSAEICSPMKMFDYLAAGRAILSSDLPVLHEVLNERNAVFCPPEDVDAWQQALAALLADAGRRQQLGQQARRDAQRYTWRGRAERALQGMALD
jgi:glycosyltransferase involved in cell wall biosynthesis